MPGTNKDKDFDIFHGERLVESIRNGGYKDTSYAIAELVDNSIDANSTHVEIISKSSLSDNGRYSLNQIGVLDNGHGMNAHELRSSLLFGDGTRGRNLKDIGKYGMGLPNASLSQCKKVEIYSWQNSNKPHYTAIDVDEIKKGQRTIPKTKQKDIPNIWKKSSDHLSKKSGTLVIWSTLDRCTWVTSKKLMEHSQFLIGRIYRKFLHKKSLSINMVAVEVTDGDKISNVDSKSMLPNDPLYLMTPSAMEGKWGKKPMFKKDTIPEERYAIDYNGSKHNIIVRYSIEKDELRDPTKVASDQGSTTHGKHARKNTGVSIIRADREIELSTDIFTTVDARDRWWGAEIDVPSSLDDLVGLTNNKQRMDVLSHIMRTVSQFDSDDSDKETIQDELETNTPQTQLFDMIREIRGHVSSMQRRIRLTRKNIRKKPDSKDDLDTKIDEAITGENKEGIIGGSDKDRENMDDSQRVKLLKEHITTDDPNTSEKEAEDRAYGWVKNHKKIVFQLGELDTRAFFSIANVGGLLIIKINTRHKAYRNLLEIIDSDHDSEYKDYTAEKKLELTRTGLWLLLASWARYEDITENEATKDKIQDVRYEWGRELGKFLEQNEV